MARVLPFMRQESIRIPPIPRGMVLTDRDDGTLWQLKQNTTEDSPDGAGHVSITDVYAVNQDHRVYAAYDGPLLGEHGTIRLLIRGGRIGYEMVSWGPGTSDISQSPVYTRNGFRGDFSEIIVPLSWVRFDDVLGWEAQEF